MDQNGAGGDDASMPPNDEAAALTPPETVPAVIVKSPNGPDADLESGKPAYQQFSGLTKEQLEKYVKDPFWVRMRWALFVLFWLIWLWMLVTAIVIIVTGPKCAPLQELDWWQKDAVYQVFTKSFKDSDGDGVGDLAGVRSKLSYLHEIGAGTVWLSPGNDAGDLRAPDASLGTMEDFDGLLSDINGKEMHLVMDLNVAYTSEQHDWFRRSAAGEANYTDMFVWAAGRGSSPPDSRRTPDGSSSVWTFNAQRRQWYYGGLGAGRPQLNYASERTLQAVEDVLRFWLDKGVHGFRLLSVDSLHNSDDLTATSLDGASDEAMDVLNRWRQLCDEYKAKDEKHRLLVADVSGSAEAAKSFLGNGTDSADLSLNHRLSQVLRSPQDLSADTLRDIVDELRTSGPNNTWNNWGLGGAGVSRIASRVGEEAIDALNMLILTLPGTPVMYYGDEIGMTDAPEGAAPHQSPMQWSGEAHAGFSSAEPWTPVNPNYKAVNVAAQKAAAHSHLGVFKKLTKLRLKSESLTGGSYTELSDGNSTFAFMRLRDGSPGYIYIINTSDQTVEVTLKGSKQLPEEATVSVRSAHAISDATKPGTRVELKAIPMEPKAALVLSFVPKPKE